jgi:hypothetical protein
VTTTASSAELIRYARRFGHAIGKQYPRYQDEIVSAALHGAAIAFASPNFPADPEGQRKFVGQCCWNMMRRELSFWHKRPLVFADVDCLVPDDVAKDVDWADEFEFLSEHFTGTTREVFIRAYGPRMLNQAEIAEELGVGTSCVSTHMKKIAAFARDRTACQECVDENQHAEPVHA